MQRSITAYQGLAGDRNDLGIPGAMALATAIGYRLSLPVEVVGQPRPAMNRLWKPELDAAESDLLKLADHLSGQLAAGVEPITVLNRCAASIATIPRVVAQHPSACVVWLDAHADLNTPESSSSGYLGGLALSGPAGLWDSGFGSCLALEDIVLVGARDLDPFEIELIACGAVQHIRADSHEASTAVLKAVAGRPIYIHLDCDVLEPGLVPTDFRVTGGFSLQSLNSIFSALAGAQILGIELAEFQYAWESGGEPVSPRELLDAVSPVLNALTQPRSDALYLSKDSRSE
jgi:arginase